jgi:hypothetical protein
VTDSQLPDDVVALVNGPVRTMTHVELLLALRAAEPEPRPLDALARETHAPSSAEAHRTLAELAAAQLVANPRGDEWTYVPRTSAAREAVDRLAQMYNEKPVTLVRALYSRPARPLTSFVDAFRLRKED